MTVSVTISVTVARLLHQMGYSLRVNHKHGRTAGTEVKVKFIADLFSFRSGISMTINPIYMFKPSEKYEGVRPIHIYLSAAALCPDVLVLGRETWTKILTHQGP